MIPFRFPFLSRILSLLRVAGNVTKTDSVYLAKGISWLSFNKFVSSATAFLLSLLWASHVPKEVYGEYKYFLAIVGIVSIASLNGVGSAVTQGVASLKNSVASKTLLQIAKQTRMKWALGGGVLTWIVAAMMIHNDDTEKGIAIALIGLTLPMIQANALYASYLNGIKAFKIFSIVSTGLTLSVGVCTAFLIWFSPVNSIAYLSGYLLFNVLGNTIAYSYTIRAHVTHATTRTPSITQEESHEINKTITYGKKLSALDVISSGVNYLDSFFLFHYLSPAQLAIYAFAQAIPNQFKGVMKFIPVLALPKLASYDLETIKKGLPRKMFILLVVGFIFMVGYIIIAPFIYNLFYPSYQESIRPSQLFAIGFFFGPAAAYAGTVLSAHRALKGQYANTLIPDLTFVVAAIFLTPRFGISGIVIAKLTAYFLGFMISLIWIIKNDNQTTATVSAK